MLISLVVDVYCRYISWQAGRVLSAPLVVARLIQGAAAVGWMAHWLACCLLACLAKAGLLASWLACWLPAWPGLPAYRGTYYTTYDLGAIFGKQIAG